MPRNTRMERRQACDGFHIYIFDALAHNSPPSMWQNTEGGDTSLQQWRKEGALLSLIPNIFSALYIFTQHKPREEHQH